MDIAKMMLRKQKIVLSLEGGGLLKHNGVIVIQGRGQLLAGRRVEVTSSDGEATIYEAENVVLAAGSVPVNIPPAPIDNSTLSIPLER